MNNAVVVVTMAFVLLSGCSVPVPDSIAQAQAACAGGARHVEIRAFGVVTRVLGVRETRSGTHEGFWVRLGSKRNRHAQQFRVEDNTSISGFIPLHRGESLALQGQYACDDSVIHWTHHDPSGRHRAGYITVGGKTYQ